MKRKFYAKLSVIICMFLFIANINMPIITQASTENAAEESNATIEKEAAVVILIKFKGESDSIYSKDIRNTIENAYSKDTKNYEDFMNKMSYGKCNINSVFTFDEEYSEDKTTPFIYEDPHEKEYYLPYSSTNTIGYKNDKEMFSRYQLFKDAFASIKDRIPKDINLDINGDGLFDNVQFIVGSQAPKQNPFFWSNTTIVNDKNKITQINGAELRRITVITLPKLLKDKYGIITHENLHLCHSFEDMYTTKYSSLQDCAENWTPMTNDFNYPTVYERMHYGKWIDPKDIPVIKNTDTYNLKDATKDPTKNTIAYRINIPNTKEYFMVEYRDKSSSIYEDKLPSSGIIVYRINEEAYGNGYGLPELYVLRNEGLSSAQAALNGEENKVEIPLTLVSGEDTGYKVQYVSSTNGEASFKLINNNTPDLELESTNGYDFSLGTTTNLNFKASGINGNFKYTVWVNDDMILDNSSEEGVSWTPQNSGAYNIKVKVCDGKGYENEISKDINVNALEITSLTSDLSMPQLINTKINLAAETVNEVKGDNNNATFTITKEGTDYNIVLNAENNDNKYNATWIPEESGMYKITFTCTDTFGQSKSKDMIYEIIEESINKAIIYFKDYKTPYMQYKVAGSYFNSMPGDRIQEDNSLEGYSYKGEIDLKDKNSAKVYFNTGNKLRDLLFGREYTLEGGCYTYSNGKLTKIDNPNSKLTINKFEADKEKSKPNEQFTLYSDTINNHGNVKYKFTATNKCTNEKIVLQDFSENSTCKASLNNAGDYTLTVEATDDSYRVIKNIDYKICEEVQYSRLQKYIDMILWMLKMFM